MLIKSSKLKNDFCANMLSSKVLSSISEVIEINFNCPAINTFNDLLKINALLCESRYGLEVKTSILKVAKFYTPFKDEIVNDLEVAGYVATFLLMIDYYLGDCNLSINEKKSLSNLNKLYRKYDRDNIYKGNELKYINNVIYFCDEDSREEELFFKQYDFVLR